MSNSQQGQGQGQGQRRQKYLYENYFILQDNNEEKKEDNIIRVKANQQLSKYISKISSKLLEKGEDGKIRKITVSGAGNAIPSVVRINNTILEKFGEEKGTSTINSVGSIKKDTIKRTYVPKYKGLDNVEWNNEIHILNFEIVFDQGDLTEEQLQTKLDAITTNPRKGNRDSTRNSISQQGEPKERETKPEKTYTKTEKPKGDDQDSSRQSERGYTKQPQQRNSSRDHQRSGGRNDNNDRRNEDSRRNYRQDRDSQSNNYNEGRDRQNRASSAVRRGGDRKPRD